MPNWTRAQEAFVARFGRAEWSRLAGQLVEIIGVARAMPLMKRKPVRRDRERRAAPA